MALGVALLAAAAQRAGSVELSAFGGGYFGSTVYQGQYPAGMGPAYTVGLNSAGRYGARLGYNVSRGFGFEFSWSGTNPTLTFSGYSASTKPKGDLGVNNFDFDAMFNFGQQKF